MNQEGQTKDFTFYELTKQWDQVQAKIQEWMPDDSSEIICVVETVKDKFIKDVKRKWLREN